MKHLLPSLQGSWKHTVLAMLVASLCTGSSLMAQSSQQHERSETLIKQLQDDPNTRRVVSVFDKALLERALSSPNFAEKIAEQSGPLYVMMHGINFEPIHGITVHGKPVQLLDKETLLAKNPSTFFILKDIQRTSKAAFVELVLHYDFDGSYNHSLEAETLMERVNGHWQNQELAIKTIR